MYIVFIFLLILGELFWEYFKYSYPEPLHVCKQGIRVQYVCESWWWVRGRPENIFYFHKGTLQTHLANQWVMYLIFLKANSFHLFTIQFAFPPVSSQPYHIMFSGHTVSFIFRLVSLHEILALLKWISLLAVCCFLAEDAWSFDLFLVWRIQILIQRYGISTRSPQGSHQHQITPVDGFLYEPGLELKVNSTRFIVFVLVSHQVNLYK